MEEGIGGNGKREETKRMREERKLETTDFEEEQQFFLDLVD